MAHSSYHEKLGTDDSDVTAFSLSYNGGKHILDVSHAASEFPEIFNTSTNPIDEHDKPSSRRREETLDSRRYPPFIPSELENPDPGRTLVLCFDGTGDQFDADNSNVVQLVSLLKKNDSTKQLVYYQAGIGTYDTDRDPTAFISTVHKTLDEMIAWSIDDHVMAGYKFLMQNYIEGDKICLFGFSRGAYTARSLAGMLYKVGLLPPGNFQQVPFAYKMYTRVDQYGWDQSHEFKSAFSVDVPIEFIGVWDTVSSLGAIRGKSLPVTTASTNARTFRHALSLDERRARFQVHSWKEKQIDFHNHDAANHCTKTDVEEVWFAGCHCDVGGGSVSNKTRRSLARIPLRWMIRECFKTNTGIIFNSHSLTKIGLDPSTLHPVVAPRPSALTVSSSDRIRNPPATPIPINIRALSIIKEKHPDFLKDLGEGEGEGEEDLLGRTEEEEELLDALSPKYDQLSIKKFWWILEILPFVHTRQHGLGGDWVRHFKPHLGRPRVISHQKRNELKVHRSVALRMKAEFEDERARKKGKKYVPKAHFYVEPTWID